MNVQGIEVADELVQSQSISTNENNFDLHERACIVRRRRRIYWTCVCMCVMCVDDCGNETI